MEYKKITLRRGKEESLLRFHPWVFSGAIASIEEGVEEGDLVSVMSHDGRHIGNGHFQIGSIAVRILAWGDTEIDENFYFDRLLAAFSVRKSLNLLRNEIGRASCRERV